jgi:hypothetical protein
MRRRSEVLAILIHINSTFEQEFNNGQVATRCGNAERCSDLFTEGVYVRTAIKQASSHVS